MKILSLDQSKRKTAWIYWDGGIVGSGVIRTNGMDCKLYVLIHHICNEINLIYDKYGFPDIIAHEGLSFGSSGNQTRDLSQLLGAIIESALNISEDVTVVEYPPQTLKAHARKFLPLTDQYTTNIKGNTIKVNMTKNKVIEAVSRKNPDILSGLKMSGKNCGLDDMADAYTVLDKLLGDLNDNNSR
jgi:hypothetical protein